MAYLRDSTRESVGSRLYFIFSVIHVLLLVWKSDVVCAIFLIQLTSLPYLLACVRDRYMDIASCKNMEGSYWCPIPKLSCLHCNRYRSVISLVSPSRPQFCGTKIHVPTEGLDIVPLHPNLQNIRPLDFGSRITWVQHNLYVVLETIFHRKRLICFSSLDGLPFQNEEFDFVYVYFQSIKSYAEHPSLSGILSE